MTIHSAFAKFVDIPDMEETVDANALIDAANSDDIEHFISVLQKVLYSDDVESIALFIAGEKNSPAILEAILKIGSFKTTAFETIIQLIVSFHSQKLVDGLWVKGMWDRIMLQILKDSAGCEKYASELSQVIGKLLKRASKHVEIVHKEFLELILESITRVCHKDANFHIKYIKYRLLAYLKPVKELASMADVLDVKNRLECLSRYILKDPWHIREDLSVFILSELSNPHFLAPECSGIIDKIKGAFISIHSFSKRTKEYPKTTSLTSKTIKILKLSGPKDIPMLANNIKEWNSKLEELIPLARAPAAQFKKDELKKLKEAKFVYEGIGLRLSNWSRKIAKDSIGEIKFPSEVYAAFDGQGTVVGAAITKSDPAIGAVRLQLLATHPDNLGVIHQAKIRGVGTALVKRVAKDALDRSIIEIRLSYMETAHDWYTAKLGFKTAVILKEDLSPFAKDVDSIPDLVLDKAGMMQLIYS